MLAKISLAASTYNLGGIWRIPTRLCRLPVMVDMLHVALAKGRGRIQWTISSLIEHLDCADGIYLLSYRVMNPIQMAWNLEEAGRVKLKVKHQNYKTSENFHRSFQKIRRPFSIDLCASDGKYYD